VAPGRRGRLPVSMPVGRGLSASIAARYAVSGRPAHSASIADCPSHGAVASRCEVAPVSRSASRWTRSTTSWTSPMRRRRSPLRKADRGRPASALEDRGVAGAEDRRELARGPVRPPPDLADHALDIGTTTRRCRGQEEGPLPQDPERSIGVEPRLVDGQTQGLAEERLVVDRGAFSCGTHAISSSPKYSSPEGVRIHRKKRSIWSCSTVSCRGSSCASNG
jgi:hypothetical protein